MNKYSRGIAPILVIVTLGLIVVTGFFILKPVVSPNFTLLQPSSPQPTPSPTPTIKASWKTYSNLGMRFEYPPGWSVSKEYLLPTKVRVEFLDPKQEGIKMAVKYGSSYDQSLQRNLTFEEYVKLFEPTQYANYITKEPIDYGSLRGFRYTYFSGHYTTEVYLATSESSQQVVTISYVHGDSDNKYELPETLDQILSTFEFTE